MRKWRGSLGLLGIVTALELRVQPERGMKLSFNRLTSPLYIVRDGFFVTPDFVLVPEETEVQFPCVDECIRDSTLFSLLSTTRKFVREINPDGLGPLPNGLVSIRIMTELRYPKIEQSDVGLEIEVRDQMSKRWSVVSVKYY